MPSSAEFTVSACPVAYANVSSLQRCRTVRNILTCERSIYFGCMPCCFHEAKEMMGKGKKKWTNKLFTVTGKHQSAQTGCDPASVTTIWLLKSYLWTAVVSEFLGTRSSLLRIQQQNDWEKPRDKTPRLNEVGIRFTVKIIGSLRDHYCPCFQMWSVEVESNSSVTLSHYF